MYIYLPFKMAELAASAKKSIIDSVSRGTVVAQVSVVHPSSVNSGFSEAAASRPNFVGSYLSTIYPYHFFLCSKFSVFKFL